MVKLFVLSGLVAASLILPAQAGTKCDLYGNCYTTYDYGGTTQLYGNNSNTGSNWNTRIQQNGNMTGTDSSGNYWNYNANTGAYWNSDGTTCYGKGAFRTCN